MHKSATIGFIDILQCLQLLILRNYAPKYLLWCIQENIGEVKMLKISRIARHATLITCGCPKGTESECGIMYRAW